MARDTSPIVKQSRREGYALHPKAHKYLIKKTGIPGQHGGNGRRFGSKSQYALQLREKQKLRRLYGLLEKQFANIFKVAQAQAGPTGDNALIMLESRLDNAVYRSGLASSRQAARQLVGHKHFLRNGKSINIPSARLKVGDEISLRPKAAKNKYFTTLDDRSPAPAKVPDWLSVDRKKRTFVVKSLPTVEMAEPDINLQLIVEYYSK